MLRRLRRFVRARVGRVERVGIRYSPSVSRSSSGSASDESDESSTGLTSSDESYEDFVRTRFARRQTALAALTTKRAAVQIQRLYAQRLIRYALQHTALDGVDDLQLIIGDYVIGDPDRTCPLPAELRGDAAHVRGSDDAAVEQTTRALAAELAPDLTTVEVAAELATLARQAAAAGEATTGPIALESAAAPDRTRGPEDMPVVNVTTPMLRRDPARADSLVNVVQALGFCVTYAVRRCMRDGRPQFDASSGTWAVRITIQLSWCAAACGCPTLFLRGRHYH